MMLPPVLVMLAALAPGASAMFCVPVVTKFHWLAPLLTFTPLASSRLFWMLRVPPKVMSVPTVTPNSVMEFGATNEPVPVFANVSL